MRIAQLAPLTESVPPKGYGGIELVVNLLTEDLVRRGHQVTLFASGDSETSARLVATTDRALRADRAQPVRRWHAHDLKQLLELEARQGEFDIIHNHMGYQALPILEKLDCPSVTTNHNPIKEYARDIYLRYRALSYVAISNAYRLLNYPADLNYVATIHNGIDVDSHTVDQGSERTYLLFLGRLCQDKGTLEAIRMAQLLGLPLKIAGKVDEADSAYFEDEIRPRLADPSVEYVGEVDFRQKQELYNCAIALLYPIAFDEPFGLVMAESLAAGTPVVALDRGSVREIVTDGGTGIIARTPTELVARFGEVEHISRTACRERAVKLFSRDRMTSEYENLYNVVCN